MKVLRAMAAPMLIVIYFAALTARAVYTYFSPDDSMNIWSAWNSTAQEVVRANLLFFLPSPLPRPLASACLRWLYSIAGFHPAPFKIVNLAILVANIFLTYFVARRLTSSRTCAAVTALAAAYHGKAVALYFDTGYVFDVLSYFFYFATLVIYLRAREARSFLTARELAALCILFVCALNCKEIAVTLPAVLLVYELLYHGIGRREGTALLSRWAGVLVVSGIAVSVVVGRVLSGTLIQISVYKPILTWHQFMKTSLDFTSNLFLSPGSLTPAMLVALWAIMLAIAWLARSRALGFAWLFLMLSPLPVAFILPRGVAQYYIPLFGWALYAGVLVDNALDAVARRLRFANPISARVNAGDMLVGIIVLLLYPFWRSYRPDEPGSVFIEAERNRSIVRQLHHLEPRLPRRARLMFLDDPFRSDWYNLTFLVQLAYHDSQIVVHRAKSGVSKPERPPDISPDTLATYDHVFEYRAGYFRELLSPWNPGPMPAVVLEEGRPQIFHQGWALVNREHPATAGEDVIVKAVDLGGTIPPLAPGETFPHDPLAKVIKDIRARFNGVPTTISTKVGWPGEKNLYRLDIRIPDNTVPGLSWLDLGVDGITGPAVEFAVR